MLRKEPNPLWAGRMGRILPALGTNHIAGFVEYRPLTNWEKNNKMIFSVSLPLYLTYYRGAWKMHNTLNITWSKKSDFYSLFHFVQQKRWVLKAKLDQVIFRRLPFSHHFQSSLLWFLGRLSCLFAHVIRNCGEDSFFLFHFFGTKPQRTKDPYWR